jgi:hypothetical protein
MPKGIRKLLQAKREEEKSALESSTVPLVSSTEGATGDETRINALEKLVAKLSTRLEAVEAENVALKAKSAQSEQEASVKKVEEDTEEVKNQDNDDDDDSNDDDDDDDDDSNMMSVSEMVNFPQERRSGGSNLVQFASILQSSHARAPTLKDLELESIKNFMRAYENIEGPTEVHEI